MFFYITIILSIILDIFSKYLAFIFLQNQINLFGNFFYLKYTLNNGIAFSINLPFLKIITLILIFGIFYYYIREKKVESRKCHSELVSESLTKPHSNLVSQYNERYGNKFSMTTILSLSFGLILGGAIGNAIERIGFGEVSDFIGVKYFAIFNFADIFITIGIFIYIFYLLKKK